MVTCQNLAIDYQSHKYGIDGQYFLATNHAYKRE